MTDERTVNEMTRPPEGVIAGEDVPVENDEDEFERMYQEIKEIRLRRLRKEEAEE